MDTFKAELSPHQKIDLKAMENHRMEIVIHVMKMRSKLICYVVDFIIEAVIFFGW